MPVISRFYGIVVEMRWREHGVAHIHVRYAGRQASIGIHPITLLGGAIQPRTLGLVMEWMALHQQELEDDWQLAQQRKPLRQIPPLT